MDRTLSDLLANPGKFFDEAAALNAFVPHGKVVRPPKEAGSLSGLSVAVKDLFDWTDVPTGAGNPAWLDSHPIPRSDAAALSLLLAAGATLIGKTVTDELAYSILGENFHYGVPRNTLAPDRVPGGSSSGSASAVAAGLVDVGLGTDTGGSIRVPAAYCGLFGLRTTHDAVSRAGLVSLAPTFDCIGWMSRTLEPLASTAKVLLPDQAGDLSLSKAWTLPEAEALTDSETRKALAATVRALGLPTAGLTGLTEPYGGLEGLRKTYATLQGWEAWETHGAWISQRKPVFGPAIAQRFLTASLVTDEEAEAARDAMGRFRADLRSALGKGGVLLLPATAGPAPAVGEAETRVDDVRTRTMRLTCPAGLAGLPQLTVPRIGSDGLPRGIGLLGPVGTDRALIQLATRANGAG